MQPNLVYVGTYTRSGQAEGIYVFRHDPDTGKLTQLHVITDRDPSFLAFDPTRRFLFAVNEHREHAGEGNGHVASYAIDEDTGNLSLLSREPTQGGDPCCRKTTPSRTN